MDRAEQMQESPPELLEKENFTSIIFTTGERVYHVPDATEIVRVQIANRILDSVEIQRPYVNKEFTAPTNPFSLATDGLAPTLNYALSEAQELSDGTWGKVGTFDFSTTDEVEWPNGTIIDFSYESMRPIEVEFNDASSEITIAEHVHVTGVQLEVVYKTKIQDTVNRDA